MSITLEEAHELVDQIFSQQGVLAPAVAPEVEPDEDFEDEVLAPANARIVRTKSSGDRVYYLDEDKKTRQWVTNPQVVDDLGFRMEDVQEVDDEELLKYQMAAALYKVDG